MGNLLAIVICDVLLEKTVIDNLRTDVHEQICDGVLVKDKGITKIILIDKETGQVITEI